VTHNLLVISQENFYITCNKFRQLMNARCIVNKHFIKATLVDSILDNIIQHSVIHGRIEIQAKLKFQESYSSLEMNSIVIMCYSNM